MISVLNGLVFLLLLQKVTSQECAANGMCDDHERCRTWSVIEGECYRSPTYMKRVCPVSCMDMERAPLLNECKDVHESCRKWSQEALCETNANVKKFCPLSCGRCEKKETRNKGKTSNPSCKDDHENCSGWADMGECDANPNYMLKNCKRSCGACEESVIDPVDDVDAILARTAKFGTPQMAEGNDEDKILGTIKSMLDYMEKSDDYLSLSERVRSNCKNKDKLCSFWATLGECEKNMSFMKIQCAPACQSCHLLDMENRCPKLPDAVPALKPGDLNKMFQRIVDTAPGNRTLTDEDRRQLAVSEMTEYSVVVHSRPGDDEVTEVDINLDKKLPPWVITLDNFLTDEECDAIIQHGYDAGYKRSEDVGKQKFDGTVDSRKSKGRTSENAWCSSRNGCREKTVPKRVIDRMSTIMGISDANSEDIQILKYEVGQFYVKHHDYIPHQKDRQCGPRILTFFLYLSDVEKGGGTDFPELGITVTPKKGRAVLWPSIYNSDPMRSDKRMMHEAMPVDAGIKFGANAWIHMFDYQAPQLTGCT